MRINTDLDTIHIGVSAPTNKEELWLYTSENLYSSSNEQGNISTSDGKPSSSSSFARTAKYIPVDINTTYSLKVSGTTQIVVYYYASNNSYISYEVIASSGTSGTFTTPNNCYYIKFRFSGASYANAGCMLVKGSEIPIHETYYAPQIRIKSNKYEGYKIIYDYATIDSLTRSIPSINNALDYRLRCVARGDLFGTVAGNKSVDITYDALGMTGNSSIYLICCAGANIAWRNVCIVSTHSSQINTVNTIIESMMTCKASSAGKLTVTNTNSTYSVTPDVRVYLLASRQQY